MEVIIFKNSGNGHTIPRKFVSYDLMIKGLYRYKDAYIFLKTPENRWIDWIAFFDGKVIGNYPTFNDAVKACPRAQISPAPEGVYVTRPCQRKLPRKKYVKYVKQNFQ